MSGPGPAGISRPMLPTSMRRASRWSMEPTCCRSKDSITALAASTAQASWPSTSIPTFQRPSCPCSRATSSPSSALASPTTSAKPQRTAPSTAWNSRRVSTIGPSPRSLASWASTRAAATDRRDHSACSGGPRRTRSRRRSSTEQSSCQGKRRPARSTIQFRQRSPQPTNGAATPSRSTTPHCRPAIASCALSCSRSTSTTALAPACRSRTRVARPMSCTGSATSSGSTRTTTALRSRVSPESRVSTSSCFETAT